MACSGDYKNPAGLKFVTRVERRRGRNLLADPGWPSGLNYLQDMLIMNIPNGVGPGTVLLQSPDAFVVWRVVDVRNRVNSTQLAYTGPASWAELYVEDGCYIHARAVTAPGILGHIFPDGQAGTNFILTAPAEPPIDETIRALWFPNDVKPPTFDALSLASSNRGPAARDGWPIENPINNAVLRFAPPGLCRYVQFNSEPVLDWRICTYTGGTQPIYEEIPAVGTSARQIPAWGFLEVVNSSGGTAQGIAINWNRLASYGSP